MVAEGREQIVLWMPHSPINPATYA
jgi:hypothetical protein